MNITNNPFGIHESALRVRSERLALLAKNIANADTPQFKARDIDFKQALLKGEKQTMRSTHANHFQISKTAGGSDALKYRVPFNNSMDGNTDYRATLSFIENKSNSIKRALRGD